MTTSQRRVDVYVRTRNVVRAGMRTFQIGDEITLGYQTDHHGVERLAGVEVLGARGVEVDGLDVETGRPHGTGSEWTAPPSTVPDQAGVARPELVCADDLLGTLDLWALDRRASIARRDAVRAAWPELGVRLDDLAEQARTAGGEPE